MSSDFFRPFAFAAPLVLAISVIVLAMHSATAVASADTDTRSNTHVDASKIAKLVKVPDNPRGLIQLPLRVYIIKDIELTQKDVTMSMWVSPAEVKRVILPEINRIWRQAGIVWVIESIVEQSAVKIANHDEGIKTIQNAKRDENGKSDPTRMPFIHAFCDKKNGHKAVNNLYLFPYMGQTSQGNASMGGNHAFVGVWTDKPSRGEKPPQKGLLRERPPMKIGSIARTCSHELGHNLLLNHPPKDPKSKLTLLMGGQKQGYDLTTEEILLARKTAIFRGKRILDWAAKIAVN